MTEQVPSSLRDIFADTLEIAPEEVTPELNGETVETWDSFRHLQLILSLEGEYNVQFDPGQIPDLTTVARVQAALVQKGSPVLIDGLPEGLEFKLLHVGVAVPRLDPAARTLASLFGYRVVSGPFDDPIQKVTVNFLTQSDDDVAEIELIAPLTDDSPIRSMLNKSGGGAYHLCFQTNDMEAALAHIKAHGCVMVSPPQPAVAFGGRRIAWFYAPTRQLFELVEEIVDAVDGSPHSLYLLYHELRPEPSSYSYALTCAEFERHLELFARLHRKLPPDSLRPELTFDDGHLSNYDHALPALQRMGLIGSFFITAGWTGTKHGYMNWEQLRMLQQAGQRIGAHGMTHTLLTHCTADQLHQELHGARHLLEDKLGVPVTTLSLPGGRYNRKVLEACRDAGYTSVFTSQPRMETQPLAKLIGRFNIRGDMQVSWIERLLQPASGILAGLERSDRIKTVAKTLLGDRLYGTVWAILNRQEPETEAGESR